MKLMASEVRGQRLYQVDAWWGLPIWHGFGTRDVPLPSYLAHGPQWVSPVTAQVHGPVVQVLTRPLTTDTLVGDAFVTMEPGIVCAIRTADCVPLLVYDPVRGVVGAIHAGWRGLAAGVIAATVATCARTFRVPAGRLQAAIGPAIAAEDFEIDAPVLTALHGAGFEMAAVQRPSRAGHWWLDLSHLAQQALVRAGLDPTRIAMGTRTTSRYPGEFHSYRRVPRTPGRQSSFIVLRGGTAGCGTRD